MAGIVLLLVFAAVVATQAIVVTRSAPGSVGRLQLVPPQAVAPPVAPPRGGVVTGAEPGLTASPSAPPGPSASARPDVSAWADRLGPAVGIPLVALAAYGRAHLVVAETDPGCRLSWPTLAGIGLIESDHGRSGDAVLGEDGVSSPPIIGVALDGGPGLARIADSDDGRLDGDPVYDRAVGSMQFIPETWARWAADGDGDAIADPFDLDDAALSAARYLCAAGGDLATGAGWTGAVLAYNASDRYVIDVRAAADEYARRSVAAAPAAAAPGP